ncbi:MAG: reverse transcriptase domain-containing protein, partial [Bacteroidota bacterium]
YIQGDHPLQHEIYRIVSDLADKQLNSIAAKGPTKSGNWDADASKHLFDGFEVDEDFQKVLDTIKDPDIKAVLWKFRDRFPQDLPSGLPPSRGDFDMKIKLEQDYKPKRQGLFRYSPKELTEMRDQISYLLDKQWIRPSHSPFGSPVLFAPKPGGKLRMCIDYRSINKGTIKSSYPLPRVEEMFDQVVGSQFFSKIDLRSGYWQIRMEESSIPSTCFKTRYGSFEWLVMPFGLSTAPSCFQHLVNSMLGEFLDKHAIVFIDDILVYSKDKVSHAQHIASVLRKLRQYGLFAKFSKCEWFKTVISFLGHVLDRKGLRPMQEKTAVIAAWPEPQNVSEVRSFLGLTGYYRKFVNAYAQLCSPLTDLTKQGVRFHWSSDCAEAFRRLKQALITEPLLRHPEPNRLYHVYTDSSARAIGGVVAQEFEDGEHPIQFESRLMTGAELNYQVHEQELLALVYCLGKFRHLLEGVHFKVFTDNRSLLFLSTQKDLSRRQARWQELLGRYSFELQHIAGVKNVVADALSRMATRGFESLPPCEGSTSSTECARECKGLGDWNLDMDVSGSIRESTPVAKETCGSVSSGVKELGVIRQLATGEPLSEASTGIESTFLHLVTQAQGSDEFCRKWREALGADIKDGHRRGFTLQNGILFKGKIPDLQLYVPTKQLQEKAIAMCHDSPCSGHLGLTKTTDLVLRHFYWKSVKDMVGRYIRSCPVCQESKPGGGGSGLLVPLQEPKGRWTSVSTDMMTHLPTTDSGYDAIIVFIDRFSKQGTMWIC